MADVSGPCSTLPGAAFPVSEQTMCDDHPDRPAVRRVQGETDSFGAEYYDLCQECLDEFRKHQHDDRKGVCDWCKKEATDLRKRRDFEEGMYGPVYDVCGECVKKENEYVEREFGEYGDDWD